MNPQPTYKKFLLPAVIIIALVIVGLLLFLKGGAIDQGAALFGATTKTSSLRGVPPTSVACRPTIGANGVPVAPAPSITVTSPNGGEVFTAGQQITVKWTSCNIPANTPLVVYLIPHSAQGQAYTVDFDNNIITLNDGQEVVTIPSIGNIQAGVQSVWPNVVVGPGLYYKVVVQIFNQPGTVSNFTAYDYSDNLFTIQ